MKIKMKHKHKIRKLIGWFTATRRRKILSLLLISLLTLNTLRFVFFKPKVKEVRADVFVKFDEGYGTTTNDNEGNVSGTITNATWKDEDLCLDQKCLHFDGAGDYISFGDDADLDFAAADDFTISFWFRHGIIATDPDYAIAKHESGTAGGYKVYMDSDGDMVFGVDDDGTWDTVDIVGDDQSKNYDDNRWHHVSAIKDGTTGIYLYVDGILIDSDESLAETGTLVNAANFYIGIDADGSSDGWDGFIDEVKIYASVRTAAQVKTDYLGSTSSRGTAAKFGDSKSYLSDGLAGYWKMDEADWTNDCSTDSALDSSGNSNNGDSCPSTTGPDPSAGKFGNGGYFDGSDDYINIGNPSALQFVDSDFSWTISLWYKSTDASTDFRELLYKGAGWSINCGYVYGTNRCRFSQIGGSYHNVNSTNNAFSANVWQHLTITGSGTASTIELYINGVDVTGTIDSDFSYDGDAAADLNISVWSGNGFPWQGNIDEVRIYNRALSSNEIRDLYNWAPGPIAHWKFDESTGTTAYDSSGNGNTASTFTGDVSWSSSKYGSGLSFNAVDSVVRASETAFFNDTATTEIYTISAWAKFSYDSSGGQSMVAKYTNLSPNTASFILGFDSTEQPYFQISDTVAWPLTNHSGAMNDGNWHHYTGIRDVATDNLHIYVDGILSNSSTDTTTASVASNADISFGNGGTNYNTNDFLGNIDDVRIYNYARSVEQIIEDMNAGHPAPGSPIGNPVGYWKFDEGYGTTAQDSSVNNNDLTLSAAAWSNSGKFGKAWDGNGTVYLDNGGDDADFDFAAADGMSITGWFNHAAISSNPDYILTKSEAGTNGGYKVYMASDGDIVFEIDDDATWDPDDAVTTTAATYDDGNWHHFAAIKDGTTDMYLYIDGVLIDSEGTVDATGTLANDDRVYVGIDDDGSSNPFDGELDELKIYRFALTSDQVKVDYNFSKAQVLGYTGTDSSLVPSASSLNSYCPPGQGSACTAPILEWKLDEYSGTTANDTSGNGNSGSFSGPTWVPNCKKGSCLHFDNSSVSHTWDDGTLSAGTIEFFIMLDEDFSAASSTNLYWLYNNLGGDVVGDINGSRFTQGDGKLGIKINDGGGDNEYSSTRTSWNGNEWYHIAYRWDGTDLRLYINGELDNTFGSMTHGVFVNSDFYLGDAPVLTGIAGRIDDFRIYNYARSPAQIMWDYNRGAPVGWWKFDECSGSDANDSSGNSNTGTITEPGSGDNDGGVGTCSSGNGNEMWDNGTTGKRNASLDFDGTDDYVNAASGISIDNIWTNGGTAMAWINIATYGPGNFAYIANKEYDNAGWWIFGARNDGGNTNALHFSSDFSTSDSYWIANDELSTGTWYHVAVTYNSSSNTNDPVLYVNGKSVTIDTDGGDPGGSSVSDASNNLIIGRRTSDALRNFDGQIDEVKIWNYTLTEKQILNEYNAGTVFFGPSSGSP
jgi:hypothetical protein